MNLRSHSLDKLRQIVRSTTGAQGIQARWPTVTAYSYSRTVWPYVVMACGRRTFWTVCLWPASPGPMQGTCVTSIGI
jgi:hypothetical protein